MKEDINENIKNNNLNCDIINIYKESGYTSFDVVKIIQKKFKVTAGHIGTLDKLAKGILPIFLNRATKLTSLFLEHDKKYIVEFVLGYMTDTLDLEGKIIKTDDNKNYDEEKIYNVIKEFEKEYIQIPPIYSAKKIDGKKMYELARKKGIDELEEMAKRRAKRIIIYSIDNIEILKRERTYIKMDVSCSSGTYIRSLVRDIAYKLNTYATMTKLERIDISDIFKKENSISIEKIKEIENIDEIKNATFKSVEIIDKKFSNKWKKFNLNINLKERFLNGLKIKVESNIISEENSEENSKGSNEGLKNCLIYLDKKLFAIATMEKVINKEANKENIYIKRKWIC